MEKLSNPPYPPYSIDKRQWRKPIDIADLLAWTYREQRADLVVDRGVGLFEAERRAAGLEVWRASADGCARIGDIVALGARIDGGGRPAGDLHPDAEAVHAAVRSLSGQLAGLVIAHARAGIAPDWMRSPVFRLAPVRASDGGIQYLYDQAGKRKIACKVAPNLTQANVEHARAVYRAWWDTHTLLIDILEGDGRLATHRATGPSAPRDPWIGG